MAVAFLKFDRENFILKRGIYLVRGVSAAETSEYTLKLNYESVEDKHALLFVEENEINLLDLQTNSGTYLNNKTRLPSMQKFVISEFDVVRFGNSTNGVLRFNSLMGQHSSGFHDTLNTSADSTIDTSVLATKTANNNNKTDSFNIPETQMVQPENVMFDHTVGVDKNKSTDNDTSIPETQELDHIENNKIPMEKAEGSQFLISTQDFNAACGPSLDDDSDDLLKNLDWIMDSSHANALPENPENIGKDLNKAVEASSVVMEALNWSKTNSSKGESLSIDQQDEERLLTATPDLFEVCEPESFNARNDEPDQVITSAANATVKSLVSDTTTIENFISNSNTKTASDLSIAKDVHIPNDGTAKSHISADKATNMVIAPVENIDILDAAEAVNDSPILQLSNKENMEIVRPVSSDFDATQVFVPKKGNNLTLSIKKMESPKSSLLVDSDLEPTQVFVSKKDTKATNSKELDPDFEPTQVFVPKKVLEKRSTSTPLQASMKRTDEKLESNSTLVESLDNTTPKPNIVSFFKQVDTSNTNVEQTQEKSKNKPDEQLFPNQTVPENELIFETPQLIADVFNQHQNTTLTKIPFSIFDNSSDESDYLEKPFQKPQCNDFDKLVESIKNNNDSFIGKNQSSKEEEVIKDKITSSKDKVAYAVKDDNIIENTKSSSKAISSIKELNAIKEKNSNDKPAISKAHETVQKKERDAKDKQKTVTEANSITTYMKDENIKGKTKKSSKVSDNKIDDKPTTSSTVSSSSNASKEDTTQEKASTSKIAVKNSIKAIEENKNLEAKYKKFFTSQVIVKLMDIEKQRKKKSTENKKQIENVKEKEIEKTKKSSSNKNKRKAAATSAFAEGVQKESSTKRTTRRLKSSDLKTDDDSVPSQSKRAKSKVEEKTQISSSSSRSTRLRSRNDSEMMQKAQISETRSTRLHSDDTSSKTLKSSTRQKTRNSSQSETLLVTDESIDGSSSKASGGDSGSKHNLRTRTLSGSDKSVNSRASRSKSGRNVNTMALEKVDSIVQEKAKDINRQPSSSSKRSEPQKRNMDSIEEIEKKRKKKEQQLETQQNTKNENDSPTTSKGKITKQPLNIMFTMVLPDKQTELLKKAKHLWQIPKNPLDCKVLVMDSSTRTVKFLIAMAKGIPIVTTKWVELFNESNSPSMSSELMFKDKAFEKEFKFSILGTLDKANKKRIFENFHFVLTEKISPQPSDMKAVVQAAGGTIHEDVPPNVKDVYLISSKDDNRLWHSFRRKNEDITITHTEAVMLAIMRYDFKLLKKFCFN